MLRILLVEDDADLRDSLALALSRAGHRVHKAASLAAARPHLADADVLLTDLRLPDGAGTDLLVEARRESPRLQVMVMTGHGTIPSAVQAVKDGARAYLLKPFEPADLAAHMAEIEEQLAAGRVAASEDGLVGSSAAMRAVHASIEVAAAAGAAVLIKGETGTGKELAARAIHRRSPRSGGPFVAVNLAALPRELVESELFGHERGAFTGAGGRRVGRFALADGGTLFLDEINSMPLDLQPKLLRALETNEVWPIGAERAQRIDARIIAAANTSLSQLVEAGRFRADLYYRLDVLRVRMPALRERTEDIPLLVRTLLERIEPPGAQRLPIAVSPEAIALLCAQPWRGNVRELKNALERSLLRSGALTRAVPRLEAGDLDLPQLAPATPLPFKEAQTAMVDAWSRGAVMAALEQTKGNVAEAAKLLRMNRTALFKLVKKLNVRLPDQ